MLTSFVKILSLAFLLIQTPQVSAALDFEAVFNEPGLQGAATTTIEDRFLQLLDKAIPGSEVLLNIYGLRMPNIAKALVKAQARGVSIGIILREFDDQNSADSLAILKQGTEGLPAIGKCSFGDCLKVCGFGCSAPAFNHNKFMLFSELSDGTKDVSIHTSNNFWPTERNNFNDFLIIKNNKDLFQSLKKYWLTLRQGHKNPKLPLTIAKNIDLHTFPQRFIRPFSPVKALLKSIKCIPGSTVHLAISRFTDPRAELADDLMDLSKAGCDVKVMIKNDVGLEKVGPISVVGDSPGKKVITKLGHLLYLFPYEEGQNGRPHQEGDPIQNALHSKIILINAPIGNSSVPVKMVVVGTHNLDVPSLKLNNEILLQIQDEKLFNAYNVSVQRLLKNFIELYPRK